MDGESEVSGVEGKWMERVRERRCSVRCCGSAWCNLIS